MKGIQSNGFLPIIAQAIAEMEELHGEFAGINEINLAELGRMVSQDSQRSICWTDTVRFWTTCCEAESVILLFAWHVCKQLAFLEAAAQ